MGCSTSSPLRLDPRRDDTTADTNLEAATPRNFHEIYELGPRLGRGSFAQVRAARRVGGKDHTCAVKILNIQHCRKNSSATSDELVEAVRDEVQLWKAAGQCTNLVELQDAFWDDRFCYLVMERCHRSLFAGLALIPTLTETTLARNIFPQMLRAIEHLHDCRIVHRDLKPDNYLIGGCKGQTVKLCDFGLSARLPPKGECMRSDVAVGTPPYMAPEMVTGSDLDEKVDVWSLGVIVYVIFYGCFPYMPKDGTSRSMKKAIATGSPGPSFTTIVGHESRSPAATAFVQSLLKRHRQTRPTAEEALQKTFLRQATAVPRRSPDEKDSTSLRQLLLLARKMGAFDSQAAYADEEANDELLKSMQGRHAKDRLRSTNSAKIHKVTLKKASSTKSLDRFRTNSTMYNSSSAVTNTSATRSTTAYSTRDQDEAATPTGVTIAEEDDHDEEVITTASPTMVEDEEEPLLRHSDGAPTLNLMASGSSGRSMCRSFGHPGTARFGAPEEEKPTAGYAPEDGVSLDDLLATATSNWSIGVATLPSIPASPREQEEGALLDVVLADAGEASVTGAVPRPALDPVVSL